MDDYLWNKTGSDPEIERIESALKSLAYRPTMPPEIPAKQFAFTAPRRSFFRFGVSFATAFLALVVIGSAWFLLRNERPATQQFALQTAQPVPMAAIRTEAAEPPIAVAPKISAPSTPKRRVAAPRPVPSKAIRPQTLLLSREEADAYRQLMTALSITSENLKIVKDKIGGTE